MQASVFGCLVVFGLLGAFQAVLPRSAFRSCSAFLRGVLVAGFAGLVLVGFGGQVLICRLDRVSYSPLRLVPTMWSLSLYQVVQNQASPAMVSLAPMAGLSMLAAFALAVASYALSYRRSFAAVIESERPAPSRIGGFTLTLLDVFSYRAFGFKRAGYRFVVRALLWSDFQRLCLSVSIALGWLLALQSASPALCRISHRPEPELATAILAAPLAVAYLLLLGVRLAFDFPATLPANWVFKTALSFQKSESAGIARRVMLAFLMLLVLLPNLALAWCLCGPWKAILATASVLMLSWCLIELLISDYRRLPFTSPISEFREDLPLRCLIVIVGFLVFTRSGAKLEHWVLLKPWRIVPVAAAIGAASYWNRGRLRAQKNPAEDNLLFSAPSRAGIQRLNLDE